MVEIAGNAEPERVYCMSLRLPFSANPCKLGIHTEILVIAVANLHRNPDYWKDRIKELA